MRAQGTIEYLVILAIIVVVSLIVVGLTTNMVSSPSTQINSTTDKVGSLTSGGITVVESVSDLAGDSIIRLQNNSGENLTLNKVSVGSNETIFNEQLVTGDAKSFSLNDLDLSCPCTDGQEKVSCTYAFDLTTQTGLTKRQNITIKTECQPTISANTDTVIELGTGTLADPWTIKSCTDLQNMNNHLDGNYILVNNIDCSSIANFSPIGYPAKCSDSTCTDETSCERVLGCNSTWTAEGGCSVDMGNICEADPDMCENECGGTWDEENWLCPGASISITCDTNQDLCENLNYCGSIFEIGVWSEPNTCADTSCTDQTSCEREVGCASTWGTDSSFTGTFNGANYTISNLTINLAAGSYGGFSYTAGVSYAGLFGKTNHATIQNVKLENATITGDTMVGGIAGYAENSLITSNAFLSGSVIGNKTIGVGNAATGGIVGSAVDSQVIKNYSFGTTIACRGTGGIVGSSSGGIISNNYNFGLVDSDGAVGMQLLHPCNCTSNGGINGYATDTLISGNYFAGNLRSDCWAGGILGQAGDSNVNVSNNFSTGYFSLGTGTGEYSYNGGFIGNKDAGVVSNAYWDPVLNGIDNCHLDGNTGCTATINDVTAYYGSAGVTKLGNDGNWVARDGNYPILSWQ